MFNALTHIVALRHKRPREQHVKIDARKVDEMLAETQKLADKLIAAEQDAIRLRAENIRLNEENLNLRAKLAK